MDELPKIKQESASAIQELVDHVQKHIRVLQSMTLPTDSWGDLVLYLIEKNLDSATRRRWEEYIEDKKDVTTTTMMEFLQRQSQLLRRSAADGGTNGTRTEVCEKKASNKQLGSTTKLRGKTTLATTTQEKRCYLCQGQHLIYNCKTFLSLAVEDRIKEIRRLRLCLNCFRSDHYSRSCRYGSCKECGERHNSLCHLKEQARNPPTRPPRSPTENPEEASTGTTLCSVTDAVRGAATGDIESSGHRIRNDCERKRVLMATAIVNVKTSIGESQLRVLLDSASELNFVTAAACKRLNIKLEPSRENISGLNGMSCVITHGCKVSLRSRTSNFELNSYCLVVPRITKKLPSFTVEASELQLRIPDNLKLADPLYFSPGHIDALIGSEFFLQLLDNGKIELGDDLLALQNTKFGWVIAGPVPQHLIAGRADKDQPSSNHTCLLTQQVPLDETLKTFWELEEYKNNNTLLSRDEERCENYFVNTTSRDVASGRFVVRLPFRENRDQLGRSRNVAMKRFSHLERKLQGNLEFRDQYIEFMREYVDLGHMSAVDGGDVASNPIYLPHHGVIRKTSLTTKLRVVFDASARTTSGLSLNDTLLVGSKLQDNIIDIVMRFRLPAIAVTADLQKMYRQILIHPNDRDYQRILWRFSPSDPITEYKLNTVTYGQACAPFLAIRCVRQLAEEGANEFSEASRVLLNDLYVDDIITGVNCEDEAIQLISQLNSLLGKGGFEAHKWRRGE
ncbi:PREDICTED: uncharacterized protein LOC105556616 [Vollenhovia emeryi]|uniref:uncharacterized protein LOC105556616 n=1 Tax=Vollenhovia emeryi TaxID=411798 RepID=UPI0005F3F91A|nr:PREDICTED: uncharacterized protein LOC105556616 [Vollenhovia emeryi]